MPKSRSSRIEIKPEIWPALQVEAVIRSMSPKDLVNMLIMDGLSPKSREFMIRQPIATEKPISPRSHEPTCRAPPAIGKRRRLSDNPDAIEQIKSLWASGERNQAKISRLVGYHRSTTFDCIKRMLENGELQE